MIWTKVTKEQICEWKKEWWSVFSINISDIDFVYRQLSRKELQVVDSTYNLEEEKEEAICKLCTLYPRDYPFSSSLAGVPTMLCEAILESSGMSDIEIVQETLSKYREEMKTLDNQLSCVIVEAFPSLKIEEIEDWPLTKSLWYLSRAEYILNSLRQELKVGPFTYREYNPEEVLSVSQEPVYEENRPPVEPKRRANLDKKIEQNIDILNDPNFDRDLLYPDIAANKKTELNGSLEDFPELSEINRFMQGKWKPK